MALTALREYGTSELKRRMGFIIGTSDAINAYLGAVDDFSLKAVLEALAHTKKARRKLKGLETILTDAAIAEMNHAGVKVFEGEGFSAVLHSGAASKEWKHVAVIEEIIKRTAARRCVQHPDVDPAIIEKIVRDDITIAYSVASPAWRSSVLMRMGIDAHDYCVKVPGSQTVEIRGPASYDENNPNYRVEDSQAS